MDNLTSAAAAETETLRNAYAGLNRGDIPAFVKAFDADVEWIELPDFPGGGTYHGLAAVTAHVSRSREDWAEGTCEPERFIVAGDKIIVFAYVRVRLKHESEWREGRLADVYTFRDRKVIQGRVFADRRLALEWAGAKTSDVN